MAKVFPASDFERLHRAAELGTLDHEIDGPADGAQTPPAERPKRKTRKADQAPALPRYQPPDIPGAWRADTVTRGHQRAYEERTWRRDRTAARTSVEWIVAQVKADPGMKEWPDFTRHVVDLLHLFEWMVDHGRAGGKAPGEMTTGTMGDEGPPDIKAARGGRFLVVELKRTGEYLGGHQKLWREEIPADIYRLWKPSGIDDIVEDIS